MSNLINVNRNINPMNHKFKNPILKLFGIKVKPLNPIEWRFKTKKTSFNTYMVHITAMIAHPYRLYSGESALEGSLLTTIMFEENTFISILGNIKEKGSLKEEYNREHDIVTYYYISVVDYIQEIIAFTSTEALKGIIHYAPCTDKKCLPQMETKFKIKLN